MCPAGNGNRDEKRRSVMGIWIKGQELERYCVANGIPLVTASAGRLVEMKLDDDEYAEFSGRASAPKPAAPVPLTKSAADVAAENAAYQRREREKHERWTANL